MIVIPKDKPLITDLNTYYLFIKKLFEHYQGIVDGGCVYFKSPTTEGTVYFDDEFLINGIFSTKNSIVTGKEAIDILFDESGSKNYSISIYEISPEKITYWANIANAELVHMDLASEFNDVDGLLKKMMAEKLTGYIELNCEKEKRASIFLLYGDLLGVASTGNRWQLDTTPEGLQKLLQSSQSVLNIKSIPLNQFITNYSIGEIKDKIQTKIPEKDVVKTPVVEEKPMMYMDMLQHLMLIFEKFINGNKKIREDFDTILKRKFMQKIDVYDFLDPFAAEFGYSNGKIKFTGRADITILAKSLIVCLKEIATENDMDKWIQKHIGPWRDKYSRELESLKISV
jgi:hypothetical protein